MRGCQRVHQNDYSSVLYKFSFCTKLTCLSTDSLCIALAEWPALHCSIWLLEWCQITRDVKSQEYFSLYEKFFPGTRREFLTTWWCHTHDPELQMRPRLLARSCALPLCKFAASRLNIKRHYARCADICSQDNCSLEKCSRMHITRHNQQTYSHM